MLCMATGYEALGRLVQKYRKMRGLDTQAALAHLISQELGHDVNQSKVSDNENGKAWADKTVGVGGLINAYRRVLNIPIPELNAAIYGVELEDPPPPRDFAEMVEADPSLSKAAKEHLVNQYGLLQLASKQERGKGNPNAKRRSVG